MFKIGEFSKLVQVSVGTLRHYDQVGLLKPVHVDHFTGYRYYSAAQLPRLHRILALKDLGFSLEQIGEVLAEGLTPEQMRGMLRLRRAQINQQLEEMHSQLNRVEVHLLQIENEAALPTHNVILKQVEPILVASVRAILPDHSQVGTLYREVYEAIGPHVPKALGPNPGAGGTTMVIWYDTEFREANFDGAAAFMLRCPVPERGRMRVHELPAYTMASTIHHGTYESIGAAHEAVLEWVEANDYRIIGPDREINLYNSHPITRDNPTYITEIQYPVEKSLQTKRKNMRVKTTEPKIEQREEQPYAGIRIQIAHTELDSGIIPQLHDEVLAWLAEKGLEPSGAPFMRYHVINMDRKLDVELGWPIADRREGDARVNVDVIPAGRYASLIYTDVTQGIEGNSVLIGWAKANGYKWDRWDDPNGDAFRSRVEFFLTGPEDDPDMSNWDTEVAIKLADE